MSLPAETCLEELQMIRCSLLPDSEVLEFVYDADFWEPLLEALETSDTEAIFKSDPERFASATFTLRVRGVDDIWFQITMPVGAPGPTATSVKSNTLPRAEVDSLQRMVSEKLEETKGDDFGLYNVLSAHMLPLLHEYEVDHAQEAISNDEKQDTDRFTNSTIYHVFFNSHHLISPKKRKALQQWTSSLSLAGFAKVGYPGIIYAQGSQENLEEFVANVKAMQWLALKVRFVEPLPTKYLESSSLQWTGWREFQRVGELGREEYIFEMGIGSSSNQN
ncbi:hypothetical protein BKA70DRAFT_1370811 [Coprinopsis sp. MPI-PUGE-AT-0042]|nr:hypothetical protein BKA70DRAFT_1370811 [Coprinopsis sp. MPI-PUGE-AT-0042]